MRGADRPGLALAVLAAAACGGGGPEPGGTVRIDVAYPGAEPPVAEQVLLEPIEAAVSALERVVEVRGVARGGAATVDVRFARGVTREAAGTAVREAITGMSSSLPVEAQPPLITVGRPVRWVYATVPPADVWRVRLDVERIAGVAAVETCGERVATIAVALDPPRVAARGLTAAAVAEAFATSLASTALPAAQLDAPGTTLGVRTRGQIATLADLAALVVDGRGTRLEDLADVRVETRASCQVALHTDAVLLRVGLRAPGGDDERVRGEVARRIREHHGAVVLDEPVLLDTWSPGPPRLVPRSPPFFEATLAGPDGDAMVRAARAAVEALRTAPGIAEVSCPSCGPVPTTSMTIDHDRASRLGLSASEIARAIRWVPSRSVATLEHAGEEVDVTFGVDPDPERWLELPLVTRGDAVVQLRDVASVRVDEGPRQILHRDRRRVVVVRARGLPATPPSRVRAALAAALPDATVAPADLRALEGEPWP